MRFGAWFGARHDRHYWLAQGAGGVRVAFSVYLREQHATRSEEGLELARTVKFNGTNYADFVDQFDMASAMLEGPAPAPADVFGGTSLMTSFFAWMHRNYDVLVFGESHENVGDVGAALWIADWFVQRQRKLVFLLEHIPGEETAKALSAVLGTSGASVTTFLETPLASLGQKSPIAAWERPNQLGKLSAILEFAQTRNIPAMGHDLPFDVQEELAQHDMRNLNPKRDERMVAFAASCTKPGTTVFCFVGGYHLDLQMTLFATKHGGLSVAAIDTRGASGTANPDIRKSSENRWEML